ncbi:MAG TPA: hypothetical protein VE591_10535, partial [Candidatus Acidoferrum sp.]|nr:hypothetical protein [Candidatus Acidoferrum sp.]
VQRVSRDEPPSLAFPHCRMARTTPVDPAEYVSTDRPGWGTRASGFIHPLIRRSMIEEHRIRYDAELSHGEDFHFVVRLLLRGARLHYLDEAYYHYKIFDNSLSRAGWERILRSFRRCCMLLREEASARGATRVARELTRREREMDAWIAYRDLTQALRGRRLLEAQRVFWRMPSRSYAIGRFAASARRRVGFAERPV